MEILFDKISIEIKSKKEIPTQISIDIESKKEISTQKIYQKIN